MSVPSFTRGSSGQVELCLRPCRASPQKRWELQKSTNQLASTPSNQVSQRDCTDCHHITSARLERSLSAILPGHPHISACAPTMTSTGVNVSYSTPPAHFHSDCIIQECERIEADLTHPGPSVERVSPRRVLWLLTPILHHFKGQGGSGKT